LQLSAISYQLSVISYQLSVCSYQLSAISYQLSVISYQFAAISTAGAAINTPAPAGRNVHMGPHIPIERIDIIRCADDKFAKDMPGPGFMSHEKSPKRSA